MLLKITEQEFHHILAGLRCLQTYFESGNEHWDDLATNEGQVDRLMAPEIDTLCEELNCGDREVADA